jgi:predicted S18 family serine protease
MDIQALIAELGLPIALVVYFIIRESKRSSEDKENRENMTARMVLLEDYVKNKLETIATGSTRALTEVSKSQERLAEASEKMHESLVSKPCLAKQSV